MPYRTVTHHVGGKRFIHANKQLKASCKGWHIPTDKCLVRSIILHDRCYFRYLFWKACWSVPIALNNWLLFDEQIALQRLCKLFLYPDNVLQMSPGLFVLLLVVRNTSLAMMMMMMMMMIMMMIMMMMMMGMMLTTIMMITMIMTMLWFLPSCHHYHYCGGYCYYIVVTCVLLRTVVFSVNW